MSPEGVRYVHALEEEQSRRYRKESKNKPEIANVAGNAQGANRKGLHTVNVIPKDSE